MIMEFIDNLMKKLDEFYDKHSFGIKLLIILCIIGFIVIGGYWKMGSYQSVDLFRPAQETNLSSVLKSGDVYEQQFYIDADDEEVKDVSFKFATYGTKISTGIIEVEILKNQIVIDKYKMNASAISDNQYVKFAINREGTENVTGECSIRLKFDGIDNATISFYLTGNNMYDEFDLFVNGTKNSADICTKVTYNCKDTFIWSYIIIAICFLIIFIIAYFMIYKYKAKISSVYLVGGLFLGIVYMIIIPIYVVPDEPAHIYTAYELSNSMLGIDNSDNGTIKMRYDDFHTGFKPTQINREYYNDYFMSYTNFFADNTEMVDTINKPLSTYSYLYLPSGIGLTIGRIIGLNAGGTFMLGRLFNLLIFTGAVFYAIKKIPFGKTIIFLWAILPMTLQQAVSFSYDSPMLALCILVIGLSLHLAYEKMENTGRIEWILLFIAVILIVPIKSFAITPICMMPMIIYFAKCKENSKIKYYIGGMLLALLAAFIFVKVFPPYEISTSDVPKSENYIEWANQEGYTLSYLLTHPKSLFMILWNTLRERGDFYFNTLLGQNLGWFELAVPVFAVIPYFVMMIIAGIRKNDEAIWLGRRTKMYLCLLALLGAGFAMAGMLLGWTPVSYNHIEGVQGRYFLPFIPLALLCIRSNKLTADKQVDKKLMCSGLLLGMLIIVYIYVRAV